MFFHNDISRNLATISINKNTGKIVEISENFKKTFSITFTLDNFFIYYVKNESEFQEFINHDFKNSCLLYLINVENENSVLLVQKIVLQRTIVLICNNVDMFYYDNMELRNQNSNLIHNNKKNNNELKKIKNIFSDIAYCSFDEFGYIIESNSMFDIIFKEKNVEKFFKDDYSDIIYTSNSRSVFKFVSKYKDCDYKCTIMKIEGIYHLKIIDITEYIQVKQEIKDNNEIIVNIIGDFIHNKSEFTANHINRVKEYTRLLATLYKDNYNSMPDSEINLLSLASALHDIGKWKIHNDILEKNGKLTPEEIVEMNKHTTYGKEMLDSYNTKNTKLMSICSIVAYEHHEKWNGKGYPLGKKGNEIHLYSRIVSLADVFDALISSRPYKKGWKPEEIKNLLIEEREKSFDPLLVDLMLLHFDKFLDINEKYKEKD